MEMKTKRTSSADNGSCAKVWLKIQLKSTPDKTQEFKLEKNYAHKIMDKYYNKMFSFGKIKLGLKNLGSYRVVIKISDIIYMEIKND